MLNKMAISKFGADDFGGLVTLQFFGPVKRPLELLIPVRVSPLVKF